MLHCYSLIMLTLAQDRRVTAGAVSATPFTVDHVNRRKSRGSGHEKTTMNNQAQGCFARRAAEDRRETSAIKPLCP
jgi:hypothetical protein